MLSWMALVVLEDKLTVFGPGFDLEPRVFGPGLGLEGLLLGLGLR